VKERGAACNIQEHNANKYPNQDQERTTLPNAECADEVRDVGRPRQDHRYPPKKIYQNIRGMLIAAHFKEAPRD
jgi:hypothetical protein